MPIPRRTKRPTDPERTDAPVLFVVDDDPSIRTLIGDLARDLGWDVLGFARLREFRERLSGEARPTLMILDDALPDGSGGDLARRLRSDPRTKDVPLLVCTAAHPVRQAEIGTWAPVVAKPFTLHEIERVLDAAAFRRFDRLHPPAG